MARLALACVAATSTLGFVVHLDARAGGSTTGDAAPTGHPAGAGSTTSAAVVGTGAARTSARASLETLGQRTAGSSQAATSSAVSALSAGSGLPAPSEPVDESLPHTHVVDPATGGLVSVAGARGVVGRPDRLGAVHTDPMPPGVTLKDPTDTATLLQRADLPEAVRQHDLPITAGSTSPVGTPDIRTLSRHVKPSCSGTGRDGNRVRVLYAHEARKASRFAQVLPVLGNEVANVDDVFAVSAQQTGGERRVRWVHDADCLPVITSVVVPDGALGADFWATISALKKLGYDDRHRKYLIFADANAFCGIGTVYDDTRRTGNVNDGAQASYARVDAGCWSSGTSVAAHELTHNLGGVQASAPHATTHGHCFDESDIMCYDDGSGIAMRKACPASQEQLLDCHHDDYFNTHPAAGSYLAKNWDTARSSFLDTVVTGPSGPEVAVHASATSATTGQRVRFTATSSTSVAWAWSMSPAGSACRLDTGTPGRADLVCSSTVTGVVMVTATATTTATAQGAEAGARGSGRAAVSITRAAAPTARLTVPATADAAAPFLATVAVAAVGPVTVAWNAGGCSISATSDRSATVSCPEGTATQALPVDVRVTQADGQAVRASVTVALSGAGGPAPRPAPEPSRWSVPTLVDGVLTGVLRDGAGAALAGRPVTVQVRWSRGGAWGVARRLATGPSGSVVVRPEYRRAGWFRFATSGDRVFRGSVSARAHVKAATRVRLSALSGHRVRGSLRTSTGTALKQARLTLERRRSGTSRWVRVAVLRTDERGNAVRRVRPVGTTSYRWVFGGDAVHAASRTAGRVVR